MKKKVMTYVLMGGLLMLPAQISATNTVIAPRLAEDVSIEGISENTVLYVGEDIHIRGYVDEKATQKEITWQITGNKEIIDFDALGNDAYIVAKAPGTLWIMARATDGSDRTREYTINIKPNPIEESKPSVEEEIKPPSGGENNEETTDNLVTEDIIISGGTGGSLVDPIIITLNKDLTSEQKIVLMKGYLKEIKENYQLKLMSKKDNSRFTGYTLKMAEAKNDFFIEIRVEKEDQEAYIPIIEMLDEIEKGHSLESPSKGNSQANTLVEMPNNQGETLQEVEEPANTLVESTTSQVEVISEGQAEANTLQETAQGRSDRKEANLQVDTSQRVTDESKGSKILEVGSLFVFVSLGAAFLIKNSF